MSGKEKYGSFKCAICGKQIELTPDIFEILNIQKKKYFSKPCKPSLHLFAKQ